MLKHDDNAVKSIVILQHQFEKLTQFFTNGLQIIFRSS